MAGDKFSQSRSRSTEVKGAKAIDCGAIDDDVEGAELQTSGGESADGDSQDNELDTTHMANRKTVRLKTSNARMQILSLKMTASTTGSLKKLNLRVYFLSLAIKLNLKRGRHPSRCC